MGKMILFITLLGILSSCKFTNNQYPKELDSRLIHNLEVVLDSLKKVYSAPSTPQTSGHTPFLAETLQNQLYDMLSDLQQNLQTAERQRLFLKAENNKLKGYALFTVILSGLLVIVIPFCTHHRKLKLKYDRLSEVVKHTEWGFLVSKEFITENHIAYDELERLLNREKILGNLNSESYNRLHEALIQQKANTSGRLFNRLTNFDGNFGTKFQQLFPEFSTDELLMATMIHHQWKITDMTTIFHVSLEALRKRRARLAQKIAAKLKKEIDLEDFLTKL